MSEIASLGVKIDSTDATRASGELDKLTAAGGRTEQAAKRVERAWEQAVQRTAAEMNALNGRVDVLNGTQSKMLAAVERVAAQMDRMAASYERSARAAERAAQTYGQVGREAGASAAGVDRVNRSLAQTESTATAAGTSIRRHLLAAMGGLSAMRLIDLADDWGQMASRIRMATESADEYAKVQARMVASANTTYRSITETREAFVQLSPVLRQMGMSLDESMDAIDAFSGLMVTNAASTDRGAAAMRALSIALQKGKLDADGWITIYSTLDSLVDVLAQHSGKSAEEIRKLGAEGKLSVELIAQALAGSLDPIMRQVDEMPTTVRDAMGNVANAFSEYIGKANESNEVTATMAKGILLLGENINGVLNVALVATAAGLARYTVGMTAAIAQTTAKAVQTRVAAVEELKFAQAQAAAAAATLAQTRAMAGLTATMAQQTAAANALTAANARLAAAQAGAAAAGTSLLGILGGPVGIAITAGLAATAFMTMGGSAQAASIDVDTLASSLGELTQKQLELRRIELDEQVASLEDKALESSRALQGLQRDFDALSEAAARGANITAAELENVKRAILEQSVAHEQNSAALDKARLLLDQIIGRLRDLDGAARGAAGGINGLNKALGFTEAGEKYLAQIQARIKALQDGGDPVKAATRWILEHADASEADKTAIMSAALAEQALQKARESSARAVKSSTSAVNDAKKAAESFERERRQYLNGLYGEVSALDEQARGLEQQIALYGLAESATYDYAIAQMEQEKAAIAVMDAGAEEIAILERKIELLQQMKGSQQTLERLDAEKQAWESWSRDVEQIFQQVGQSLTDAIFEGGKSARDLVRDLFKTLTLRVLIQPVMSGLQGLFMGAGPAGVGTAAGAGSGLMSNAGSLFSMFGGNSMGMGISNVMSSLSTSSMLQGTGVGNWLMGASGNVAGMSNLALGGAGLLGGLGAGLVFGNKGYSSTVGGLGATAGMALGGPIGAVAGSLLGGAVGSLFGDDEPRTRHGQRTTYELGRGITQYDDRQDASAGAAAAQIAQQAVDTANSIFRQVGVDAAIDSFYAVMESSIKGDRDGVASGGTLRVGDQLRNIGVPQASDMTLGGFGGWSDAEMLPRLATDIQLTMLEAFQQAGDALPSALSSMLEGVFIRGLDEAGAADLTARFSALAEGASAFLRATEVMPHLEKVSFDAAAGLVQLAGGVDNLLSAEQSYYQAFHTEAERHQDAVQRLTSVLGEAGIQIPELTGSVDDMMASYRTLVEAQDINTEAGRQARWALVQASQAFAEVATYAGAATAAVDEAAASMRSAADILRERQGLELQLLQLQGNTAEIRRRELAGLDASNHALQQHIWSLQDQAAAAQTARSNLESAYQAMVQAGQAEIARLRESFGVTDSAMSAYRSAVQRLESDWGNLLSTISRGVADLRGQVEATAQMQYDQARAVISTSLVTGRLPQTADLSEAIRVAQQGVTGNVYASRFEQERAYLTLANEIEGLRGVAEPELDAARATLAQLEEQYAVLRGTQRIAGESLEVLEQAARIAMGTEDAARQQISVVEQQLEATRQHYEALTGIRSSIDGGVLTLSTALANYASAAAGMAAAGMPTTGGSDVPGAGGAPTGPGSLFARSSAYYAANPDVASAWNAGGTNMAYDVYAKWHYDNYGRYEGRASFDVGINRVPYDMDARIHKDEAVVPARFNPFNPGAMQWGGKDNNREVVQVLLRLEKRLERLEAAGRATAVATGRSAQILDDVTQGGTDVRARITRQDRPIETVEVATA